MIHYVSAFHPRSKVRTLCLTLSLLVAQLLIPSRFQEQLEPHLSFIESAQAAPPFGQRRFIEERLDQQPFSALEASPLLQQDNKYAVIFIGGVTSHNSANDPAVEEGFQDIRDAIESNIELGAHISPDYIVYFSYTGEYAEKANKEPDLQHPRYDWNDTLDRSSAATQMGILRGKLTELITSLPDRQIILVAHSMGGVIATYWAAEVRQDLIKRVPLIITISSPLQGSNYVSLLNDEILYLPDLQPSGRVIEALQGAASRTNVFTICNEEDDVVDATEAYIANEDCDREGKFGDHSAMKSDHRVVQAIVNEMVDTVSSESEDPPRHSVELVSGPGDSIQLAPGDSIPVTWELRHTGTSLMGEDNRLVVREGGSMVSPDEVPPDDNDVVASGGIANFSFDITAPQEPGRYTLKWRMNHRADGDFGPELTLKVVVVASGGGAGGSQSNGNEETTRPSLPLDKWSVSFWNNRDLSGNPVRTATFEPGNSIRVDWQNSPYDGVNAEDFSTRFEQDVNFPASGRWKFTVRSDDGFRLFVDDRLVGEEWSVAWHDVAPTVELSAGQHRIRFEHFDADGPAKIELSWALNSDETTVGGGEWQADYFNTRTCWDDHLHCDNPKHSEQILAGGGTTLLDKDWGGDSPGEVDKDYWTGRFRGTFHFPAGEYVFYTNNDDALKLKFGNYGQYLVDSYSTNTRICDGNKGYYLDGDVPIELYLREDGGEAKVKLSWSRDTSVCLPPTVVDENNGTDDTDDGLVDDGVDDVCTEAPQYELTDDTNGYQELTVEAGTDVTVTWGLRNPGGCAWLSPMSLAVQGGTVPVASLDSVVPALIVGETFAASLNFVAPTNPGDYFVTWQLKTNEQQPVGQSLTLALEVTKQSLPPDEPPVTEVCDPSYELVNPSTREIRFQLEPGDSIDIPWEIVNTSDCTWAVDGVLAVTNTTLPTAPAAINVPALAAGKSRDLGVVLVAPDEPGIYEATWQMYSADGAFIGETLTLFLIVPGEVDEQIDEPEEEEVTPPVIDEGGGPVTSTGTIVPLAAGNLYNTYWSADGSEVMAFNDERTRLSFMDPLTGQVTREMDLSEYGAGSFRLSQDTTQLIQQRPDGTSIVVDLDTGEISTAPINVVQTKNLPDGPRSWSPDNSQVSIVDGNGNGAIWDATTGELVMELETVQPFADSIETMGGTSVYSLAWSPNGQYILYTEDRGSFLCIWIAISGAIEHCVDLKNNTFPTAVWDATSTQVVVSFSTGFPIVYDLTTRSIRTIGVDNFAVTVALSPDMRLISTSTDPTRGRAGPIHIWDVSTGELIYHLDGLYTDAQWSPDGTKLLVATATEYERTGVVVWIPDTTIVTLPKSLDDTTQGTALLLAFRDDFSIRSIRSDGKQSATVAVAPNGGPIEDLAWSPTGTHIAYIARDGLGGSSSDLYIVDLKTGEQTRLASVATFSPVAWFGTRIAFIREIRASGLEFWVRLSYVDLSDGQLRYHDVTEDLLIPYIELAGSMSLSASSNGEWLALEYFYQTPKVYHMQGNYPPQDIGASPIWIPGTTVLTYIGCSVESANGACPDFVVWQHDVVTDQKVVLHTLPQAEGDVVLYWSVGASVSNDGEALAFHFPSLNLYNLTDGSIRQLAADYVLENVWSPTDQQLAYIGFDLPPQHGEDPRVSTGIFIVDRDGGASRHIVQEAVDNVKWQPVDDGSDTNLSQMIAVAKPVETIDAVETGNEGASSQPTTNGNANLRAGPGTDYPIVGKAPEGTVLIIVGRNAAGDWCQLASGDWIAAYLVDNAPSDLPEVETPSSPTVEPTATQAPVATATPQPQSADSEWVVFDGDPRDSASLCDGGFRSDCGFEDCGATQRLVWGPFCRARDHSYIQEPGLYRVTVYGSGHVIAGATDTGPTEERYTFGSQELTLPGSYTFCWPGLAPDGFGFETIVEGIDGQAKVDRMVIEFMGEQCD